MNTDHLDTALLASAMTIAAEKGWSSVTLPDAARDAGLDMGEVRRRFPFRNALMLRLGTLADQAALVDDGSTSPPQDALFDLLMRRFDVFQQYRTGVIAVMSALPFDPILTALLGIATLDSMKWIGAAAGIDTSGPGGLLRVKGLTAVWMHTLRAWKKDESEDLGSTMAALEEALAKAARFGLLRGSRTAADDHSDTLPDLELAPVP
ncbi:TetR family transcriptional regulator [Acetobacter sp. AN02]|uniref:TetR family transcriptional regulator n=1 Tax=Acetobacter sp. AN02 TaxID=2894186 RepID=UPI00243464C4|nr:TetR family transcriptional regulator [Acetobacter sp. AN02]MDG6095697.1 TetR family transcriptional regulator [Acetobacter sp. AN02]